jgi:translation initiation factor IF-1
MTQSGAKAPQAKKAASRPLNRVAQMKAQKNQDLVQAAVNGEIAGLLYGRVEKHFGCSRIQVLTEDLKLHNATIRNLLRNKRATCIEVNDVVILQPRDFETHMGEMDEVGIASDESFDVIGVVSERKDVKKLQRNGIIPSWMTTGQASDELMNPRAGGAGLDDDDGFEFDYESEDEEECGEDAPAPVKPTRDLPPAYDSASWAAKRATAPLLPNGEIDIDRI